MGGPQAPLAAAHGHDARRSCRPERSAMKIIGYPAALIYRPGERARFMVSTEGIPAFDAELVRIICGDSRETGPGFKESAIASCRLSAIPGRAQATEIGSYMTVPAAPVLNATSFGLLFNVFATTPTKGDQTLFAR